MKHECWQNLFCANNGIHPLDKFYADCESLFWQCGCSQDDLCGAVSDNGVCAVDLARVVARHRSDTWCQQQQVVRNGLRHTVHRSTLADGNEHRDWRIWADLAALLIRRARKVYWHDELGLELRNTIYALDATTIDLCLSLFNWAPFRSTKAAISCTLCLICVGLRLRLSTSAMESARSQCDSISCRSKRVRSM
jgi:hypothetical protein